jgi:hypothetical protein
MAAVAAEELGPWSALPLSAAVDLFSGYQGRWWVSGGHALDLFMGSAWRVHEDTDISILRYETSFVRDVLAGWDIQVAASGRLCPWVGRNPRVHLEENNLWCRPTPDAAWCLDLTMSDGDLESWIYRRDPAVRVHWSDALLHSPSGVPYLAPELQLLFKSKHLRHKDTMDAQRVIPALGATRRQWLQSHLPARHPWLELVA